MTRRPHRAASVLAGVVALGALGLPSAGCGKKALAPSGSPPEITGLAVVPADVEVIVGADPAKLAGSPLIDRMAELLMRDATLADRWRHLKQDCKIDVTRQIKRVMLALGPHAGRPGTGPRLMIVTGSLPEADLKDCVTRLVGAGGGTVTGKVVLGRTMYFVQDGTRTMYFAYSRPDTVVLGTEEAYVTQALGTGKKAPDNPELTAWRKLVNENSPLWMVGRVDARVGEGLVQVTEGKVSAGPVAVAGTADLADGAKVQMSVLMNTPDQAKSLESFVGRELGLLTAAAQWKSLGPVVGKLGVTVDNAVVQFHATLTVDDLNQVLSALDGQSTPAQDRAPPHPGSGSGTK